MPKKLNGVTKNDVRNRHASPLSTDGVWNGVYCSSKLSAPRPFGAGVRITWYEIIPTTVSAIRNMTPRRSAGLPHQVFGCSR